MRWKGLGWRALPRKRVDNLHRCLDLPRAAYELMFHNHGAVSIFSPFSRGHRVLIVLALLG